MYFENAPRSLNKHPKPGSDEGVRNRLVPEQKVDQIFKVVLGRDDRSVLGLELAELVLDPVLFHLGVADGEYLGD